MRTVFPLLLCALLTASACNKVEPVANKQERPAADPARDTSMQQACASQDSYERLKTLAFEQARQVRGGQSETLDRLASASVVRMEKPVVKSRDDALNVTLCAGRIVIELPPGAQDAFNGERRLVADIEYAAQSAADGSGLVYQLKGAEPLVYRLAAIDLKSRPSGAAVVPQPVVVAEARPATPASISPRRPASAPIARSPERSRAPFTRPSFDCRDARTRAEQMVCTDEDLAARDRDMASVYYQAIEDSDSETRAMLRRSRDRFLARRERCDGPACVAAAYEDRVDEIDRIASGDWR